MAKRRVYSDEELEDGLDLLAELIDRYGEVYWPIFDRLEIELSTIRKKKEKITSRLRRCDGKYCQW